MGGIRDNGVDESELVGRCGIKFRDEYLFEGVDVCLVFCICVGK